METVRATAARRAWEDKRELAPKVWLRQTETEGQFVEIVLPPFELSDLLEDRARYFPMYPLQVVQVLSTSHPELVASATSLSPELTEGLKNTQILGTLLTRHQVRGERARQILPELQQAFGLAMQGRLRLTADPVPEE